MWELAKDTGIYSVFALDYFHDLLPCLPQGSPLRLIRPYLGLFTVTHGNPAEPEWGIGTHIYVYINIYKNIHIYIYITAGI